MERMIVKTQYGYSLVDSVGGKLVGTVDAYKKLYEYEEREAKAERKWFMRFWKGAFKHGCNHR